MVDSLTEERAKESANRFDEKRTYMVCPMFRF